MYSYPSTEMLFGLFLKSRVGTERTFHGSSSTMQLIHGYHNHRETRWHRSSWLRSWQTFPYIHEKESWTKQLLQITLRSSHIHIRVAHDWIANGRSSWEIQQHDSFHLQIRTLTPDSILQKLVHKCFSRFNHTISREEYFNVCRPFYETYVQSSS